MLKIQEFLINHPKDWETVLREKPYSLHISKENGIVLFKYNQIDSDFSKELVQEARGLILEEFSWKVLRMAFKKFFNQQESKAAKIDWSTARIQEKVDGSLISLWFYRGEWRISTSGTIDARKAQITNIPGVVKTFGGLFGEAFLNSGASLSKLDTAYCYSFELCSPYNRIVVPYRDVSIRHIGSRNVITLEEEDVDIGIPKPDSYSFSSLDNCLSAVKELPFDKEGYVVVDGNWNRIKIKSPAYVMAHHIKNNGVVTAERILDLIRSGEHDEFLAIYPEFKESFDKIKESFLKFSDSLIRDFNAFFTSEFWKGNLVTPEKVYRKSFAVWAFKQENPNFLFQLLDKKIVNVKEYIEGMSTEQLLKNMEIK
jgi:hypothetical protein